MCNTSTLMVSHWPRVRSICLFCSLQDRKDHPAEKALHEKKKVSMHMFSPELEQSLKEYNFTTPAGQFDIINSVLKKVSVDTTQAQPAANQVATSLAKVLQPTPTTDC